jgi:AraC-like DNA-binding protein
MGDRAKNRLRPFAGLRPIGVQPSEAMALFDYVEDAPVWMKDAESRYTWVNLPFLLNYGLEHPGEVLERTDFDLSSLALANQYRLDDARVLKGECIASRVELVGRFDHTARWCATSKVPLHDPKGRVAGTAGITLPLRGRLPATEAAPLSPAIQFISEHYAQNITNRQLARLCNMSLRTLERHFLATYHASPHEYLRQLRVRMSCRDLVFSRKTLAVVAGEVGFADHSHYTKEFRRVFGETPSAYRARYTRR